MSKIAFVADPSNPSQLVPKDPAALATVSAPRLAAAPPNKIAAGQAAAMAGQHVHISASVSGPRVNVKT